jgi:hypothetical protein
VGQELTGTMRAREDDTCRSHRCLTLDGFRSAVSSASGVRLSELSVIDELEVQTRNSSYRITILDPADGRVLVQGGAFFPLTRAARLGGASLGGSMLKVGWIGCGFCIEIHCEQQRIVTTPVRAIAVVQRIDSA